MLPNLIAPFSQVNTMAGLGSNSAAATAGACHNFTLDWISQMKADGGTTDAASATQRMDRIGVRSGAGNPVLQKVFGQRWAEDPAAFQRADEMMIMMRGLREVGMAINYSAYSLAALVSAVNNPIGCGMVYSFWFTGSVVGAAGGAHTIGFFRALQPSGGQLQPSSTTVSCFDPNFGECAVPVNTFGNWVTQMSGFYGPMNAHMLKVVDK